jgi:hypothetical protein
MPGTKEKPVENVYDKVATALHKEYDTKGFHSIEKGDFKDYVSYFNIRSVYNFKKSLGIEKSDRGFSKMKMMERLREERLRGKSREVAREVRNKGILPYAREGGNIDLLKPMPVKNVDIGTAQKKAKKMEAKERAGKLAAVQNRTKSE